VTDREEGLVNVMVGTLLDGDPTNNFFKESDVVRFNPGGELAGASHAYMAGHRLYVVCKAGLIVVEIKDPRRPVIVGRSPAGSLNQPRQIAVQHLHAFITDADGVKVFDLSDPDKPVPIPSAAVPLRNAQGVYAARTYLYVAAGEEGLAIVDIKNPAKPALREKFNAGGVLNDARAVQIGSINASMFALVADGANGHSRHRRRERTSTR